ncbi:uncharacterized protein C4orf19 homolog [Hyperolius riggenbachi]|uniref:uncharacterized protein C4orf19 homolog n=1 Tax=Hyperolius riggenbachi TaxID=752182 RepID=UPI0035A31C6D
MAARVQHWRHKYTSVLGYRSHFPIALLRGTDSSLEQDGTGSEEEMKQTSRRKGQHRSGDSRRRNRVTSSRPSLRGHANWRLLQPLTLISHSNPDDRLRSYGTCSGKELSVPADWRVQTYHVAPIFKPLMGSQVLVNFNQMGCNCCRMLNSYMFKPQELHTNGYVNEAHSYEHDRSKSPTIKISELMNEGHNVIERDKFTGSQVLYGEPEKINAKYDEADSSNPATVSSYAILNINFVDESKEQDGHSSHSGDNFQSKIPPHGSEQDGDLNQNSDEPECIQHELCGSIQGNNSLTESAILEVGGSTLTLNIPDSLSYTSDLNELPTKQDCEDPYLPDTSNHDYVLSNAGTVPITSSGIPTQVSASFERSSLRDSKKASTITNGIHLEDDLDPDVAEALAALAAAIAGEDYEDC